ncbi:hypothetical protein FJ420_02885 [Mesorhizobium sp. B3-1-3]|uniref:hypothetical protein n=1 Tax=unclassified Mesorhizobium TaxID=325217 RepID=UPI001128EFC6|nr:MULTISPECIES: hypothetical protein [unclassified Mesorhizobium]TPI70023.1 hypothetical protein FJ424_03730 [Mesorhizobium sp. B3-1-8]TPI75158.1 hypothetical protein FJ420_02885 [Mesorhizobium sp. B3-1-3]
MPELEATLIEKYFLGPGSGGTIGSVFVPDEDILEIFSVSDAFEAQRALVKSLPRASILRSYLSGEIRPTANQAPNYIRILIFLCWMQTTKTRQRGDRDFREMIERHIGESFRGASMRGLNPMWEHLRNHLEREHAIQLHLPAIHPHSQIGRTLRIAFPTWRDRAAFRKLRQDLDADQLLDPLLVSNRLNTTRHLQSEKMPSFEHNFKQFDMARKRGGRAYMETPFWQAWYSVVAEQAALECLEIAEGEFGEFELFRISPIGTRETITTPEEAVKYVPKPIGKAINNGVVLLENIGFGRYRATSSVQSNVFLLHRSKLDERTKGAVKSFSSINSVWILVSLRGSIEDSRSAEVPRQEFGWHGGIRVGGAYLGRAPLTPVLTHPAHASVSVEMGGTDIELVRTEAGLAMPLGTYSGGVIAHSKNESREILLVPRANEVGESRRLAFDVSREFSEDEFYFATTPSRENGIEQWSGRRFPACQVMVTIGEALYARTARGLSLAEAFEIASRGLSNTSERPSEWDILRAFGDSGWFDFTLLRRYPARRLLQCPVTASECSESGLVRISGPTPIAVVERLAAAADAAGVTLESLDGGSAWALPRYLVRAQGAALQDFLRRSQLPAPAEKVQATPQDGDPGGVHGYQVISRLDEERGFFVARTDSDMADGLYRLERKESLSPFLFRSVIRGLADRTFLSASLAILSHGVRRRKPLFAYDGSTLSGTAPRVSLPSSWARWVSDQTLCNAGLDLHNGRWRYVYPVGERSLEALSKLVQVIRPGNDGLPWVDRFIASASNADRTIYDSRAKRMRTAYFALGK